MTTQAVRKVYRELLRHAQHSKNNTSSLTELRTKFRTPVTTDDTLEDRLKQAESRLAFLRMTSGRRRKVNSSSNNTGKWIYKDGERLENVNGTLRDGQGRVVSNWSGSNLDPESMTTHRKQLNRMGFKNNAHAKGFF
ncbi:hypothetical protein MPSEU_000576300 [Mayamaea pseudoterrestris]|nr:hypothetical protein MPSEU_000576300 [Mayamaea pseudoterrestris]